METTRRDVLLATAAIPIAVAVAGVPLTVTELRVLAMTATPPETWVGREHEYSEDAGRVVPPGSDKHRIVHELEARGLVEIVESRNPEEYEWVARATPAGRDALRHAGVLEEI